MATNKDIMLHEMDAIDVEPKIDSNVYTTWYGFTDFIIQIQLNNVSMKKKIIGITKMINIIFKFRKKPSLKSIKHSQKKRFMQALHALAESLNIWSPIPQRLNKSYIKMEKKCNENINETYSS